MSALTELELANARLRQSEDNVAMLCEALCEYLRLIQVPVVPGASVLTALQGEIRRIQSEKDVYL